MQIAVTIAAAIRKAFEVLIAVTKELEAAELDVVLAAADALPTMLPATAAGAARAPIAAAIVMVKTAVGPVRVRTVSTTPAIRSRSISLPRASRCFTASSLIPSASATTRTD